VNDSNGTGGGDGTRGAGGTNHGPRTAGIPEPGARARTARGFGAGGSGAPAPEAPEPGEPGPEVPGSEVRESAARTAELRADCAACFGLCCVGLAFSRSADFARDKKAGEPCEHLDRDERCGIHPRLRERGYRGCSVYDCFGAGQKLSRTLAGGTGWRQAADGGAALFAALPLLRQLHELLWYLTEIAALPVAAALHREAAAAERHVRALADLPGGPPPGLDPAAERAAVNPLLLRASALVRAQAPTRPRSRRGADLAGARLRGKDLRGTDFRGAYLMGADLRDADLRHTDMIGADLRGTDLRGADLTHAVFLTQAQAAAARGDGRTRLPARLLRPAHWGPAAP
jgi:uncharacterized protein YjbI with pentapeptide repeats